MLREVRETYVRAESRLVAALGLNDIVVLETPDAVLVITKHTVHEVEHIVAELKSIGCGEALLQTRVHCPRGSQESQVASERFHVKRIIEGSGHQRSLKMHHHRAEPWIVVKCTAWVTGGDHELILREDQPTKLPVGTRHRLANPGTIPLEIIEVKSGSYLGEENIVRFENTSGRVR